MSKKSSAKTGGPLSTGFPDPLNTRPEKQAVHVWTAFLTQRIIFDVCTKHCQKKGDFTQHVFWNRDSKNVSCKFAGGVLGVNSWRPFEHLERTNERNKFWQFLAMSEWNNNFDTRRTPHAWTIAFDPLTSNTWPLLWLPSCKVKFTISANLGNWKRKQPRSSASESIGFSLTEVQRSVS